MAKGAGKSGDKIAEATRHPVTTQRNGPRVVLLNIEDHQRLCDSADNRHHATLKTMPDDLLAEIDNAVAAYAETDDELHD